jgi:hypothetical protein
MLGGPVASIPLKILGKWAFLAVGPLRVPEPAGPWYQRRTGSGVTIAPGNLRYFMDDEPKTAAEMKEIRLNRKLAQDAEGIKAMADIAAADIAIRQRTANLRAMRLAKEAADRLKPVEPKAKKKKST